MAKKKRASDFKRAHRAAQKANPTVSPGIDTSPPKPKKKAKKEAE